jgi:hypothetical protein
MLSETSGLKHIAMLAYLFAAFTSKNDVSEEHFEAVTWQQ